MSLSATRLTMEIKRWRPWCNRLLCLVLFLYVSWLVAASESLESKNKNDLLYSHVDSYQTVIYGHFVTCRWAHPKRSGTFLVSSLSLSFPWPSACARIISLSNICDIYCACGSYYLIFFTTTEECPTALFFFSPTAFGTGMLPFCLLYSSLVYYSFLLARSAKEVRRVEIYETLRRGEMSMDRVASCVSLQYPSRLRFQAFRYRFQTKIHFPPRRMRRHWLPFMIPTRTTAPPAPGTFSIPVLVFRTTSLVFRFASPCRRFETRRSGNLWN